MFRYGIVCTLIIFSIAGLFGCSPSSLDFSIDPLVQPHKSSAPTIQYAVGVDSFVDMRPQRRGSDNKKWLGFIPGVLWLEIDTDLPELYTAYSPYNSRSLEISASEAIYKRLKESAAFKEVVFLPIDPYKKVDYRLEGILYRSLVQETGYYYGSSVYAWLTRIFGFPYVSYRVTLDIELRLRDLKDNTIIWDRRFKGTRESKFHNIYSLSRGRMGRHFIAYNFAKILDEQLKGLEGMIGEAISRHESSSR